MRKFLVASLLFLGAAALAMPAFAEPSSLTDDGMKLMNAKMVQELKSRASRLGTSTHPQDTTYVGYNPAYAGSNYWSIGVGHRRPKGTTGPGKGDILPVPDDDTGYWDFEHASDVHGDSLQGWWPVRNIYRNFYVANLNDKSRSWFAIDHGNQISYVINQGDATDPSHPGVNLKRTFGVTSAWHVDDGGAPTLDPAPEKSDVNPVGPAWTPIGGTQSAWCGIRGHGDIRRIDPVTGNPYNADAYEGAEWNNLTTVPGSPGFANSSYPGYVSQWDQMLYRDIDISGASDAALVSVTLSYRTRMSILKNTSATTATGWFDKDPLAIVPDNFISASDAGPLLGAPIDSFMVYVGNPVPANGTWLGSDNVNHSVYDPARRWFAELIRANEAGGHYQLLSTYGDNDAVGATLTHQSVTYGALKAAWGNTIRLVIRVKTNFGQSDDANGSFPGAYNSGYMGAAQVDDVSIDLGGGPVALGDFEDETDIDNSPPFAAGTWQTSSKPPAIYDHVHGVEDLIYEDLCGPVGGIRICNLAGNVVSMGDHDTGERLNNPGPASEKESFTALISPTINLSVPPVGKNSMGLDADTAVPEGSTLVFYDIYLGGFDVFLYGITFITGVQSYPAEQADGTRTWGHGRFPGFTFFNPDKQCFDTFDDVGSNGQVVTTNPGGQPDSIRIWLRKAAFCWRLGITTTCGTTLGGYWDNVSLGLLDADPQDVSVDIWELYQDTFPANEDITPGLAAFDTTAALIKGGRNTSQLTGDATTRYNVPADSLLVQATGDTTELQLKFRIFPGPGNYVALGDPCSGLRREPSDTTRINPFDGSFWTEYILNSGKDKQDMPTNGACKGGGLLRHDQRWDPLVWCNARMDTAEFNLFPIDARNINGGPVLGRYATMYHEEDKHFGTLSFPRHKCFLIDTLGAVNSTNITCSTVPDWVTDGGAPYRTGYDGNAFTTEFTKILPDGILTPGSHVQYFFFKKDLATGATSMVPDTNTVFPQLEEGSFDAHRWQQFSVLPDAWKFAAYGGLGKACMLYVDWGDRRGDERIWVSIADSIGATSEGSPALRRDRKGAHNGWVAQSKVDLNDPGNFVNKNYQPGTTWDMYGVKASESLNTSAGPLGARLANRTPGTLLDDKWGRTGPTPEMLEAYYRIVMIQTGDLNSGILGPFLDRSDNDTEIIHNFLQGATAGDENHRALICGGDGFVEDLDGTGNTTILTDLRVSLRDVSYASFAGNVNTCPDLIPTSVITTNGDIYGFVNTCVRTFDVLNAELSGVPAALYDPVNANPLNAPYVSAVFSDATETDHWQSLVHGWDWIFLRSRLCDKTYGKLTFYWNMFTNAFGKLCGVAGAGTETLEVPNNSIGKPFVEFAGQNPLRQGNAEVRFTLVQDDRVTVKIYDVSGRLVRTLADAQSFKAKEWSLSWDGLDNSGRRVARGAYFVNVKLHNSLIDRTRKMIVLK